MKRLLAAAAVASAISPASLAQAIQQTAISGSIVSREQIVTEMKDSRYQLGQMRVQPVLSLRNLGFSGGVAGTTGYQQPDLGATIGAGARIILPVARKTFLRVNLVPEYTWFRRRVNQRILGGNVDAAALFLFNRFSADAHLHPVRTVAPVSSEDPRSSVVTRVDKLARVEFRFLRRLSLFGTGQLSRPRYDVDSSDGGTRFNQLDRNDTDVQAGVLYQFRSYLRLALGAERTQSRFLRDTSRDNHSSGVTLNIHYERPRTFMDLVTASHRAEGEPGSSFPAFSTGTGSYFITHQLAVPWIFDVAGRRNVTYSLFASTPYFIETRNGAGITIPIRRRLSFRAIGEAGTNSYPAAAQAPVSRLDRVTTFGGGLSLRVYRDFALTTLATQTRYNSNLPGFDRSVFTVTTNLNYSIPLAFTTSRDLFQ